jgi:hypothetical protein
MQAAAPVMPDVPPASTFTPEQEEQLRAALRNAPSIAPMATAPTPVPAPVMQPQPVPAPPAATMPASSKPAPASANFAPLPATPTVVTTPATAAPTEMPSAADSREGRLAELLMLYKADKISPSEYQARRAKIMSGQ